MRAIYLDSNILIAYYSLDRPEAAKKQLVKEALAVFEKAEASDVWLCTSAWAVTEMVNILISAKKMDPARVADIESRLFVESFGGLKLHGRGVSPDRDYDFARFFADVRAGILKYHSGVGDVIHSVIMKNHGIDYILTFDERDFKQIPGLTVFHPRDVIHAK
jgi:predicted nucleic acid-binding protein